MIETARGRFELVDEGRGAPVVLVHGFPFDARSFADEAHAFAEDVRVLVPSMRGFGATPLGDGETVSIDGMADDVAAILDASGIEGPVVVGGLSMGGYVAMAFARRHAARLRALVLADTRADADGDEARANRDAGIAKVSGGDLAGFVDGLLPRILGVTTRAKHPEVADRVRAMALSAPPASVVATLRALRDRPDARPGLAHAKVPALVIVGEEDALMPPPVARAVLDALPPGAALKTIPEAGHLSNLENPAAFRGAVRDFLRSLT